PANWMSPTLPGAVLPVWAEPFCIWSPSLGRAGARRCSLSSAWPVATSTAHTKTSHDPNSSRAGCGSAEPGEALLIDAVHLGERAPGLGATPARRDGRDADRAPDDIG